MIIGTHAGYSVTFDEKILYVIWAGQHQVFGGIRLRENDYVVGAAILDEKQRSPSHY